MLVSGLLTPLAVFVRLSLRSTLPADWQQHFRLSGCGLPLLLAPRWFSLAVVCDAALDGIHEVDDVLALWPRLRSNGLVPDPGRRFESDAARQPHTLPFLGDHPLGIATRSTPTPRRSPG